MSGEPFIEMAANNVTVTEGQTQLLSVSVRSHPARPNLTWFRNGQPMATDNGYDRFDTRSL